jgi:hypothetical protein
MVQWVNTKKLDNSKGALWYPSWYTPDTKHGETQTASIVGEMPTWEIIQREDRITVFEFDETKKSKEGGLSLPQSMRKYFG